MISLNNSLIIKILKNYFLLVYGFYSMYDEYQIRITNLSSQSDYLFINDVASAETSKRDFLKTALEDLEVQVTKSSSKIFLFSNF